MLIYRDAAEVARAMAEFFVGAARAAIAERGAFNVVLSGGNTPRAAYELLAGNTLGDRLSWENVFVYFGDERCVPPEDERSNYRMAYDALLGRVPIPESNVFRIRGEIDPGTAANEYGSLLRTELADPPHFDLLLLGLGEDGHTASLFPGTPPDLDDEQGVLVKAVYAQSQAMWRITLTPKVINAAHRVLFAVEGASKARALAAVYDGPIDPVTYPAQIVRPASGSLTWLVDESAASLLRRD
jgi:6-phosphogluconolactonase